MAYMGRVLDLIQERGLSYALGRVLEEIAEGAVAEDEEEQAAHVARAWYFLGRHMGSGEPAAAVSAETAGAKGKAGGDGRQAGKNPQGKAQRQCEVCEEFKGLTTFEKNGRKCLVCRRAAARS
jgi:hypothetical protein